VSTALIGLTTDTATTETGGHPVQRCVAIPERYLEAVEGAGGRPILLPPSKRPPDEVLNLVDALIVIGGCDVDPHTYGATDSPAVRGADRWRDDADLRLLRHALRRRMPVLGICRGSEMLNVAHGGAVVADLDERARLHLHDHGGFGEHAVDVEPESRLGKAVGARLSVHTYHHSGIGAIGAGLRPVAHAPDGTVEAVESSGAAFAVGVLWHPEMADRRPVFDALVAAATEWRASRASHAAAG
jgi:putative glutamine amidotransferase